MKKILLVVVLVCVGMAASAQFYLGGSLGLGLSSTLNNDGDKLGIHMNISLMPDFGYSFNDRWDLGIVGGYGVSVNKLKDSDNTVISGNYAISPYVRYSFLRFGKFKVMGKAKFYCANNNNEIDTKKFTTGLNISPVLGYNLSDHIILLANLNFFEVGLDYTKVEGGDGTMSFNLGGNTNNVLNTGAFQIGFAFVF
ncbi:MAG: porin family protein [Bacteroidales bacterium]|jgi:hypothetical protein|nr:porin family protein [Bacteroidales bacterium]